MTGAPARMTNEGGHWKSVRNKVWRERPYIQCTCIAGRDVWSHNRPPVSASPGAGRGPHPPPGTSDTPATTSAAISGCRGSFCPSLAPLFGKAKDDVPAFPMNLTSEEAGRKLADESPQESALPRPTPRDNCVRLRKTSFLLCTHRHWRTAGRSYASHLWLHTSWSITPPMLHKPIVPATAPTLRMRLTRY